MTIMAELNPQQLLEQLATLLGPDRCLPGSGPASILQAYCMEWRDRMTGSPLCVVLPQNTAEVVQIVNLVRQTVGCSIVPQGGNTGLALGGVPDASGQQVLLSLRRMRALRSIDADNFSLVVEAGCVLQTVQNAAADVGLLFPLSLGAEGSCTIGGNLATNAGGTQVLRYGCMRDLCLGLEVVTAQGQVWDGLLALRKDNTGYDLRHLLIGSEGTLGIITAASLKLFPAPQSRMCALLAVRSLPDMLQLLTRVRTAFDSSLSAFEAMGRFCLQLVQEQFPDYIPPLAAADAPWFALIEVSANHAESQLQSQLERALEPLLEKGVLVNVAIAQTLAQQRHFWRLRESIPMAQQKEGLNIKHDISMPSSLIPAFVAEAERELGRRYPGVRFVNYGHWGDGNVHFNAQCPLGGDAKSFMQAHAQAIDHWIYDCLQTYRGSISAEHGIGSLKRDILEQYKDPVALHMMRQIKRALDPQNILNPGRVINL